MRRIVIIVVSLLMVVSMSAADWTQFFDCQLHGDLPTEDSPEMVALVLGPADNAGADSSGAHFIYVVTNFTTGDERHVEGDCTVYKADPKTLVLQIGGDGDVRRMVITAWNPATKMLNVRHDDGRIVTYRVVRR